MIFLGAGASAPFNIPTSPILTEKLEKVVEDRYPDLLPNIKTYIKNRRRDYNYENMLKLLYVVTNPAFISRNDWTQGFPTDYGLKGDYSDIIDEMYSIIYEDFTDPFNEQSEKFIEHNKIEKIYNLTYDALLGVPFINKHNKLIFTTNYDPSLEIWGQKRNVTILDGGTKENNPDISYIQDNALFINSLNGRLGSNDYIPDHIPLIRLHGSLLRYETNSGSVIKFNRIRDDLTYPDLYREILNKKALIILPGREHLIRGGLWDFLHRFYEDHLVGECLFIGYSFRHEEINDQIKYNLSNGKITRLGVFAPNPDNNLENLFENENIPDNIVRIKGKFGTEEGMAEFIDKWWISYSSKDVYDNDLNKWLNERKRIYS